MRTSPITSDDGWNRARCLARCVAVVLLAASCEKPDANPPSARGGAAEGESLARTTTSTGVEMIRIPAGSFTLGDAKGEDDEAPVNVAVGAFWMDRTEVTQADFLRLMGRNPSKWKEAERPVERVSWSAAAKYCNARSLKEGLRPCYDAQTLACDFAANGYRLPTEAEWEYACRAATRKDYSFGADAGKLRLHAWMKENAGKTTHPVGLKAPNPWGLRDMHGNVAEWCNDFYDESYAAKPGEQDPRGPPAGDERVLRGGSWRDAADRCRSAARGSEEPGFADVCFGYEAYGFRCVRRGDVEKAGSEEARPRS